MAATSFVRLRCRPQPKRGVRKASKMAISAITGSSFSHPFRNCISPKKVEFSSFLHSKTCANEIRFKWRNMTLDSRFTRDIHKRRHGKLSPNSIMGETEKFLISIVNMSFLDRLSVAWRIVFPSSSSEKSSNAMVAKKRLKMILFSDRCAVTDEAKRKIVSSIVRVLSEFVEIESQDQVELNVSTDSDIGTIYSVIVPVRRVKPEYQEWEEIGGIRNIRRKDIGERAGLC